MQAYGGVIFYDFEIRCAPLRNPPLLYTEAAACDEYPAYTLCFVPLVITAYFMTDQNPFGKQKLYFTAILSRLQGNDGAEPNDAAQILRPVIDRRQSTLYTERIHESIEITIFVGRIQKKT